MLILPNDNSGIAKRLQGPSSLPLGLKADDRAVSTGCMSVVFRPSEDALLALFVPLDWASETHEVWLFGMSN